MLKKITALFASVCIAAAAISSFTVTASAAEETKLDYSSGVVHISEPIDLQDFAEDVNSGSAEAQRATVVLDKDIDLYNGEYTINIGNDSDKAFKGVFDGNGYTISNLEQSLPRADNGLFGFTDGATIKNLTIENADINMIYAGGIVVTSAKNTKFMNISVKDSNMQITRGLLPGLAGLIADGLSAGAIAGEASAGTMMYNCESVDTVIGLDSTHLTDAIEIGKYYIGGLSGVLNNSHIEYSRVISNGTEKSGGIQIEYQSIIGALEKTIVCAGGIAGQMQNDSSIIDSFSNAYVKARSNNVLALVQAAYCYVGGITGTVSGENCHIKRSQYSGIMEQSDFDGLLNLLGTGEQENKHLGGIVGVCLDENITPECENVYYNSQRLEYYDRHGKSAHSWKESSYRGIEVIGIGLIGKFYNTSIDLDNVSSYNSDEYEESSNFADFDFEGNKPVNDTPCSELFVTSSNPEGTHYNKWVMKPYNYGTEKTTMPVHDTAAFTTTIYSNEYNAFTDQNPESMPYVFTTNNDNTVTLPSENNLTSIKPNLNNSGFIGIAFVSERNAESGTAYYTCDMLYAPGSKVSRQIIDAYSKDPDKKIYGVWCQAYTVGAQLGLNNTNKGIRVLTAVNTDLLENIGLTRPDQDYFRGATFTVGDQKYMIKADSTVWYGEDYISDKSTINSQVENAKVFSIFADIDESDYNDPITYQGDILYNGITESAAKGLFDFLCNNSGTISVQEIAQDYISDLETAGRTEDEHYGLTDEAYDNLMTYAGETEE